MNLISVKVLAASAAYLYRHAYNMVDRCFRTNQRSASAVVDGYIVTARVSGNLGTGTIIDTNCKLAFFGSFGGTVQLTSGGRNLFDSRTDPEPDGPYTVAGPYYTLGTKPLSGYRWTLGYSIGGSDPSASAIVITYSPVFWTPDLYQSTLRHSPGLGVGFYNYYAGFPMPLVSGETQVCYAECIPYRSIPDASDLSSIGVSVSENILPDVGLAGYKFVKYSPFGYAGITYQRQPPVCVLLDSGIRVVAIPVCKQVGNTVADWGHAALLLLGIRTVIEEGQSFLAWHNVWYGEYHTQPALSQTGGWSRKPYPSAPFLATDAEWQTFWFDNESSSSSIGSRPSIIDSLTGCVENAPGVPPQPQEALFRFRYANLCQHSTGSGGGGSPIDQTTASADALVELSVTADGFIYPSYPFYDIAMEAASFSYATGATVWTVYGGALDAATLRTRVPAATFRTSDGVVIRVDQVSEQPRAKAHGIGLYDAAAPLNVSSFAADGLRISSAYGTFTVNYQSLGYGLVQGLTDDANIGPVRAVAFSSLPMQGCSMRMNMLSKYVFGFLATQRWDYYDVWVPGTFDWVPAYEPSYLVTVDIRTGVATVLGATGAQMIIAATPEGVGYVSSLSVIQRQIVELVEGVETVVVEGVYIVSQAKAPGDVDSVPALMRISRDSGATWQDYVSSGELPVLANVAGLGTEFLNKPPGEISAKES